MKFCKTKPYLFGLVWAFTGHLLEEQEDQLLQQIVKEAAEDLSTPMALVNFVMEQIQFFKAHHGLPEDLAFARGTDRNVLFCSAAMSLIAGAMLNAQSNGGIAFATEKESDFTAVTITAALPPNALSAICHKLDAQTAYLNLTIRKEVDDRLLDQNL